MKSMPLGVTLAQLVQVSVSPADVQGFKPRLGHNLLSRGVFLVKSRHFGLPLAQIIRPNWQFQSELDIRQLLLYHAISKKKYSLQETTAKPLNINSSHIYKIQLLI